MISFASGGMTDALTIQKRQAEEANERAKQLLEESQRQIESLINAQIDSANKLIASLDANTAALSGKGTTPPNLGQPGQPGQFGQTPGVGQTQGPTQYTPLPGGYTPFPGGGYIADSTGVGTTPPSTVTNSPEVAAMLAKTDALLAKSQTESSVMEARMAELKKLEVEAARMDRSDRMGYGNSQARENVFDGKLSALLGTSTFDFGAIQENIDNMLVKAYEQSKSSLGSYKQQAGYIMDTQGTAPKGDEAGATFGTRVMEAGDSLVRLVENKLKPLMDKEISVSITVADNRSAEATITRVG